jgi:hypothetical protein
MKDFCKMQAYIIKPGLPRMQILAEKKIKVSSVFGCYNSCFT